MKNKIDQAAYLLFSRDITPEEQKNIIEFKEWLPDKIIDCHAHCNLQSHVQYINAQAYNHMLSTFPSFSLKKSKEWNTLLHPGKIIFTLRFPSVFKGIDHKKANSYLLEKSPSHDRVALFGISDDISYTIKALEDTKISALKMYHSYSGPAAKEIYQFFPKEILIVAQEKNIPIILHPPQQLTECIGQILKLIDDFPFLKICLAHMGLTKFLVKGLENALSELAGNPNIVFDTSLVMSADVIETAVNIVGQNKVMYGSDAPLNLIRSKAYEHPQKGRRLATNFPYHWVDKDEQKEYGHIAANSTHDH